MVKDKRYAREVNEQVNPNTAERVHWKNLKNAIGKTDNLGSSEYTVKNTLVKDKKTKKNKKVPVYNYPYKVTAHDFGFNIPLNAVIKSITFGVRMSSSKNKTGSTFPSCGFYIKDKLANTSDAKKNKTGWHNGIYWVYSNKELTTYVHIEKYVMNKTEYDKGGYTVKDLNSSYFGIDLNFADNEIPAQVINLKWIWCEIEYDLPELSLTTNHKSSINSPHTIKTGVNYSVIFTLKNSTSAKAGTKRFDLSTPNWGTVINDVKAIEGSYNDGVWTVNCGGNSTSRLRVSYTDYTVDSQMMALIDKALFNPSLIPTGWSVPTVSSGYYYRADRGRVDGYDETTIRYGDRDKDNNSPPRKRHCSCFNITSKFESNDEHLTYKVKNSEPWVLRNVRVDEGYCDNGVEFDGISIPLGGGVEYNDTDKPKEISGYSVPAHSYFIPSDTNIGLHWTVPSQDERRWGATLCGYFLETGEQTITGKSLDSKDLPQTLDIDVLEPYSYHIGNTHNEIEDENNPQWHERLVTERINFVNHRVASNLETGAYVLPCKVKDADAVMVEKKPSIRMYKWEQIDYIGCVPIEHYHFDPKSTYKDKLLDNHYKNKRYMGKELASDEDIDLNIRLHPKQVTTIQGLIDMDKPIPINANHRIWEGDSLNHRGWAEIYGITAEKTNENWYKCSIDVKYLTHNLNTRFNIKKGTKTFNMRIPSLLTEVRGSGEPIIENSNDDFFMVETDGTYSYAPDDLVEEDYLDENGNPVTWIGFKDTTLNVTVEDEEGQEVVITYVGQDVLDYIENEGYTLLTPVLNEHLRIMEDYTPAPNLRNEFGLDEGQHLHIQSKNPLSRSNEITCEWSSSIIVENNENNVSRVFAIKDKEGNSLFEYEYFDFKFDESSSSQSVADGTWTGRLTCQVIARRKDRDDYIEEFNNEISLNVDVEANDIDDPSLEFYGSKLHFILNDNSLSVTDEGYSGSEVKLENILLEKADEYYYDCYWLNKNNDADSGDITSYFDFTVSDNILDSRYSKYYNSLYVSPFPINGKKIVYSRNAEEGVIYYLEENAEEFSYLIEPYYQYHNGVDLRASSDGEDYISIFNLNYGYKTVYLENGLVSLGINRLNGQMYLRKWDDNSKQYVELFNLHLKKFDDVNINSISDDRIELQASDTVIIMYRGHPYVIFKHLTEDIELDTPFYRVFGERVDTQESSAPTYFDLMNDKNLLNAFDEDTIYVKENTVTPAPTPVSIGVEQVDDDIYENEVTTFRITGELPTGAKVHYLIDGDELGYTTESTFPYTFKEPKDYSVQVVYVGDDTHAYSISNELIINAQEVEVIESDDSQGSGGNTGTGDTPALTGKYKLTMNCKKTMEYRDGSKIVFTLTRGGQPVPNVELEVVDFKVNNTQTTDANGQVVIYNRRPSNTVGKYKIGARYWLDGDIKKQVWQDVTVKKATPEIILDHKAVTKGNTFGVKLIHKAEKDRIYPIVGQTLTMTENSRDKKKKTNDKGYASIKINKKDKYKYTVVFGGNKNYKSCKYKTRETVGD